MKKYYIKQDDGLICAENCKVKTSMPVWHNVGIGSITCQECEHCKGHNMNDNDDGKKPWIKCDVLEQALGEITDGINASN